jgi:hypothetical protein
VGRPTRDCRDGRGPCLVGGDVIASALPGASERRQTVSQRARNSSHASVNSVAAETQNPPGIGPSAESASLARALYPKRLANVIRRGLACCTECPANGLPDREQRVACCGNALSQVDSEAERVCRARRLVAR